MQSSAKRYFCNQWVAIGITAIAFLGVAAATTSIEAALNRFAVMGGSEASVWGGVVVLIDHAAVSLMRVCLGTVCGVAAAYLLVFTLISITPGRMQAIRVWMLGYLRSTKNFPLLALIPLFTFCFGGSELSILSYLSVCTFLFLSPALLSEALQVSESHRFLASRFAPTALSVWQYCYVPAIARQTASLLRWLLSLGIAFSLGAELTTTPDFGLGVLVYQAYHWSDVDRLVVLLISYVSIGTLLVAGAESVRALNVSAKPQVANRAFNY